MIHTLTPKARIGETPRVSHGSRQYSSALEHSCYRASFCFPVNVPISKPHKGQLMTHQPFNDRLQYAQDIFICDEGAQLLH